MQGTSGRFSGAGTSPCALACSCAALVVGRRDDVRLPPSIPVKDDFGTSALVPAGPIPPEFAGSTPTTSSQSAAGGPDVRDAISAAARKSVSASPFIIRASGRCRTHVDFRRPNLVGVNRRRHLCPFYSAATASASFAGISPRSVRACQIADGALQAGAQCHTRFPFEIALACRCRGSAGSGRRSTADRRSSSVSQSVRRPVSPIRRPRSRPGCRVHRAGDVVGCRHHQKALDQIVDIANARV